MPTDRARTAMAAPYLIPFVLVLLFLGSLAACGGGGGSPGVQNSPIKLQAASTGNLAVAVFDLPAGAAASVHVIGPANFAADLTASQTLGEVAPGEYTVSALPVVANAATWIPAPSTQTVTVTAGATATANVHYAAAPAQLGLTRVASGLGGATRLTAPSSRARAWQSSAFRTRGS